MRVWQQYNIIHVKFIALYIKNQYVLSNSKQHYILQVRDLNSFSHVFYTSNIHLIDGRQKYLLKLFVHIST